MQTPKLFTRDTTKYHFLYGANFYITLKHWIQKDSLGDVLR